jgi:hypothetical protein
VTGISPGRYLWRIAIAFHMGPRDRFDEATCRPLNFSDNFLPQVLDTFPSKKTGSNPFEFTATTPAL